MAFEDRDRGKEMQIKEKARLKRKPAPSLPPECAHNSMVMSLYLVQHEKNLCLLYCKDCGKRIPFELLSDEEWKVYLKKLKKAVPR